MPAHVTACAGGKTRNWQQLWVVTASSDTRNEYYNGYDLYTVPARRALYNTHLYTGSWETIKFRGICTCYETQSIARRRGNVTMYTTTTLGKCSFIRGWNKRSLTPRKKVDCTVTSSILQMETALYSAPKVPSAKLRGVTFRRLSSCYLLRWENTQISNKSIYNEDPKRILESEIRADKDGWEEIL